jgi:hypothetical protein
MLRTATLTVLEGTTIRDGQNAVVRLTIDPPFPSGHVWTVQTYGVGGSATWAIDYTETIDPIYSPVNGLSLSP